MKGVAHVRREEGPEEQQKDRIEGQGRRKQLWIRHKWLKEVSEKGLDTVVNTSSEERKERPCSASPQIHSWWMKIRVHGNINFLIAYSHQDSGATPEKLVAMKGTKEIVLEL